MILKLIRRSNLRGGKRPNSGRKAGAKTSPRTIKFNKMVTPEENETLEQFLEDYRQNCKMKGGEK